jgi:hypothetical protein
MVALHLGTYALKEKYPELSFGCCSSNICAVILDRFGNALKEVSTGVWGLQEYSKSNHTTFCIPLNEHQQRAFYYFIDLADDTYTLNSNDPGDFYSVEFWYRATTDNDYDRESDILLEVQKFKWDENSKTMIDYSISETQKTDLSLCSAIASIGYDSSSKTLRALCWLHKNGILVEDTSEALITWHSFSGELIVQAVKYNHMVDSDGDKINGIFKFEISGVDINPDIATPFILEITDADSNVFKSCTSVVTYD